ncbi:MAG: DNA topoisomerase I [Acidobacteria bacterium]|nr:MAG: DNA topoisomerase I [Acidobacteriota bacterium]
MGPAGARRTPPRRDAPARSRGAHARAARPRRSSRAGLYQAVLQLAAQPERAASAAGLHYVTDAAPGLRRRRVGRGVRYLGPRGRPVRDRPTLARIQSLVIPPAWRGVWICRDPLGHIQATGRDARGRKQYRYHPRWRAVRDEAKFGRMLAFGQALPIIRARADEDLARRGLPRRKVVAAVIRLLEATLIRVGNEEYARDNGSFGLTTFRDRHASIEGSTVVFSFRGKSGKEHRVGVQDRRLSRIVKRCQELPGQELFQYTDGRGTRHAITSSDVNAYVREVTGQEFTAKDFRTWAGTVLAAWALREMEAAASKAQTRRNVKRAVESVAQRLGNTVAICRKCYVHPVVIDAYLDGSLAGTLGERLEHQARAGEDHLRPEEMAVLALLHRRLGGQ